MQPPVIGPSYLVRYTVKSTYEPSGLSGRSLSQLFQLQILVVYNHILFPSGFYVRKYIYNYYSRKKYLEGVLTKNEVVR